MSVGTAITPEGAIDIKAFVAIRNENRNIHILQMEDGSLGFVTESYLAVNEGKKVENVMRFTETTFAQLLLAMVLSLDYFKVDLKKYIKRISEEDQIRFEYGGNGDFDITKVALEKFTEINQRETL